VGSNEHSVGLLGVPVEEFELDLDPVVEALAPLVDVVVAAVTAPARTAWAALTGSPRPARGDCGPGRRPHAAGPGRTQQSTSS